MTRVPPVQNQVQCPVRTFQFFDKDPTIASMDLMEYVFTHVAMMNEEDYWKLHLWMEFQVVWSLESLLDIYMDMPCSLSIYATLWMAKLIA